MKSPELRPWMRSFYRGNQINFTITLLLTLLETSFNLIFSTVLGAIVDIITTGDLNRLLHMLYLLLIMLVVFFPADILQIRFKSRFIQRALIHYKAYAFSRLSENGISALHGPLSVRLDQ